MSQSVANILVHSVFSTKGRFAWLRDAEVRKELHAYMAGVLNASDCHAVIINGTEDHVHVLSQLSRNISPSGMLEEVKKRSSKWIKTKGASYRAFKWQAGYGAFAVSESLAPRVRAYIANQEAHHRKLSFQDEYRKLCVKHRVPLDERYAWD